MDDDGGIGEAKLTLHRGGARVERLVGSDALDGLKQLLCSPTLQPDEFDWSSRPAENLTGTL